MKKKNKTGSLIVDMSVFFVSISLLLVSIMSCQKEIPDSIKPTAPSIITFQKTYGGPNDEYIGNVQPTNDSGYVIIGTTKSYGAGDGDIYVIKVNAQGSVQWTKTYGALYWEGGEKIKQTKDGGYILGGAGDGYENYILIKTDAEGNIRWSKSYAYFGEGNNYDLQLTDDGGYIIMSQAYHNVYGDDGSGGAFCIKTDENGNILWHKKYGGGDGLSIAKTTDGGYAILGAAKTGYGLRSTQLTKIDANGNLLWSKLYSLGTGTSVPASVKKTDDGSFLITGTYIGVGNNIASDVYVMKTDANGNVKWFKTYGGTDSDGAQDIEETTDGGYMFSGTTGSYQDRSVLLIKTDTSGKVKWSKSFGGAKESYSYVRQAKDRGFIVASHTSAFGAGGTDLYLIKTDNSGNSGCHENPITTTVTALPTVIASSPYIDVSTGSIYFTVNLAIGTGGVEKTICYK